MAHEYATEISRGRQVNGDSQVASAMEKMERRMAMVELSLKDLSEVKGRIMAQAVELDEQKHALYQLIEQRKKGDVD
eukprot:9901903-Prorocentrum_lima.AAC.1